jgi:hypothetical protein
MYGPAGYVASLFQDGETVQIKDGRLHVGATEFKAVVAFNTGEGTGYGKTVGFVIYHDN